MRVAAYNGDGQDSTFTTYGAPAEAVPFPIMTMEQVMNIDSRLFLALT